MEWIFVEGYDQRIPVVQKTFVWIGTETPMISNSEKNKIKTQAMPQHKRETA